MNYEKHYNLLIEKADKRNLEDFGIEITDSYNATQNKYKELCVYGEQHHIIPKCLGGDESPENMILFLPEEHFIAHQILLKIYNKHPLKHKLIYACNIFARSNNKQIRNNKIYSWIRKNYSLVISDKMKDTVTVQDSNKKIFRVSVNDKRYVSGLLISAAKGRHHSDATKIKISEAHKNKSSEEKLLIKNKKQNSWKKSKHLKMHSTNTRKRRLLEEQNKTDKEKEKFKETCKDSYWSRPKNKIKEHHKKQSKGVKLWHETKSAELEKQRTEKMRQTKLKNKCKQMNNGYVGKLIPKVSQERYLFNGWSYGMLKR